MCRKTLKRIHEYSGMVQNKFAINNYRGFLLNMRTYIFQTCSNLVTQILFQVLKQVELYGVTVQLNPRPRQTIPRV